jgi:PDDEXK-like domain of unknown function (DUF3799)
MNGTITSRQPFGDYLATPGISITRLKEIKRSPQHYQHRLVTPYTSDALTLGTATHCATLEPERFECAYAIWSRRAANGNMAPRKGQFWDEFCFQNDGKSFLTEDEASDAMTIAAVVRASPIAMRYLGSGEPEVSMTWEMQGRACRGRIDWLTIIDGHPVLVGLKSARDCRQFVFGKQAAQLSYDCQWAWYFNGYKAITGKSAKVIEIVVESKPPHAVAVYRINDDILLTGEENYNAMLLKLDECERTNEWPGPEPEETELLMPSWYFSAPQDDISDLGLIAGEQSGRE